MFKNKGNYPYPILTDSKNDYKNSTFNVAYKYKVCKNEHRIRIVCNVNNKEIQSLINSGKASYAVQLECTNTFLREMRKFNYNEAIDISLKNTEVIDRLDVGIAIIANEDIMNFKSEDLIDVYQSMQISFKKNEPIAVAPPVRIDIVNDEEIFNEVHSIFNIVVDEHANKISYDPHGDRIRVGLPSEIAGFYMNSKKTERIPILNSLIFTPVLVDLISQDSINFNEFETYSWCKTLKIKISKLPKDMNVNLENACENALEVTQVLMKNLLIDSIYGYKKIFETFDDKGDELDETKVI